MNAGRMRPRRGETSPRGDGRGHPRDVTLAQWLGLAVDDGKGSELTPTCHLGQGFPERAT